MTDRRSPSWKKAREILADALDLPDEEREPFLREACGEDRALLDEVRSLLEASRQADGWFDGLAGKVSEAAEGHLSEIDDLTGQTFGHYQVREIIGRGGMGHVYRAFDSRLAREVALKVLPTELAREARHVARFRREAQLVASMSHPNIAGIHGVEELDDRIFLVLELVEGPTLADRLALDPPTVEEGLEIGRQVAEALQAAHAVGVVHRDLKPANVKVGDDGTVRVLDFGIAKVTDRGREPGVGSHTPSAPSDLTAPGAVLGTAAYMSPEQARGRAVDERSDVWSFGTLLFELLTGQKAFQGEDQAQVLARILEAEPDWNALPPETPESVRALLRRCLEKSPRRRLQAIGEARIVLEDAQEGRGGAAPFPAPRRPSSVRRTGSVLLLAAAAVAAGFLVREWVGPRDGGEEGSRTLRLAVGEDAYAPVIAPTGDKIAFAGPRGTWVIFLDGSAPRRLEGTDGGYAHFWSPDGRHVGFTRDAALWRVPVDGGAPSVIAETPMAKGFFGAAWRSDGTVVAAHLEEVVAYPETGGTARVLWRPDRRGMVNDISDGPGGGILLVLERQAVALLKDGEAREIHRVQDGEIGRVAWAPPDHVLFVRSGPLSGVWALPVTPAGDVRGDPFRAVDDPAVSDISASRHGDLAYLDRRASRQERALIWVDRAGQPLGVVGEPQAGLEQIELAPSGRLAAATAEEGGDRRIWIHDLESGERYQLSPMPYEDPGGPSWAPDGRRIVFRFNRDGARHFGVKSLEPGEEPVPVGSGWYPVFAPDGRILFDQGGDIFRVHPARPDSVEPWLATPGLEARARPSSRGLVAFSAITGTSAELFITRYEDPSERWQVSLDGGGLARWAPDGSELFYLKGDTLMAVAIAYDGTGPPRIGRPTALFTRQSSGTWGYGYAPHPDGDRFLALQALPRGTVADLDAIVLVERWAAAFRER